MPNSNHHPELRIPRRGSPLGTTVFGLISLILLLVAIWNLFNVASVSAGSIAASLVWLLLVAWIVIVNLREEGGARQYLINRLGAFFRHHFVRAVPDDGKADQIRIGYLLLGRPFYYLVVDVEAISSIDWSSGQATSMRGKDMADWSVALWYWHPDGPRRKSFPGVRDEAIFIIGPNGPREAAESLGRQLAEFLTLVGIELQPGRDDCELNTPTRRTATKIEDQRHGESSGSA